MVAIIMEVITLDKINWKFKLASRKFWALLAGLAIAVLIAFGSDAGMIERVVAAITALGSIVAYVLGEAQVDAARAKSQPPDK